MNAAELLTQEQIDAAHLNLVEDLASSLTVRWLLSRATKYPRDRSQAGEVLESLR